MYPNVGGFFFSCIQMGLYFWYRKPRNVNAVLPTTTDGAAATVVAVKEGQVIELPAHTVAILSVSPIPVLGVHKIEVVEQAAAEGGKDQQHNKAAAETCRMAATADGNKPEVIEIVADV
uniref:Uncharacterized protein n=1 Tax=Arundo donax TaxID=35708 RepID=A0A0A9GL26_ARUDO